MSQLEFTANWLQALMLAADNAAARRIRPWMTDMDAVSAASHSAGQTEAARRLWEYANQHGLGPLLAQLPLRQPGFRFEDDECFRFQRSVPASSIASADEFIGDLGLIPSEWSWRGLVTQADWTNLLRREAVRRSKGLNVQAIPASSMVNIACTARWDTEKWMIQFEQPNWLILEMGDIVHAERPSCDAVEAVLLDVLADAQSRLPVASKPPSAQAQDAPWMRSVTALYPWHRSILLTNEVGLNAWMRRVWAAVWPVIYRERNRLRGECDLSALRQEVAECFREAPLMTEWMFLFARLVCAVRFERGLGIAADFVDEFP
ncbi:MAG: hypothetical protein ACK553_17260 [Planctomycetota bacterium]|jgi:hypothetical protein